MFAFVIWINQWSCRACSLCTMCMYEHTCVRIIMYVCVAPLILTCVAAYIHVEGWEGVKIDQLSCSCQLLDSQPEANALPKRSLWSCLPIYEDAVNACVHKSVLYWKNVKLYQPLYQHNTYVPSVSFQHTCTLYIHMYICMYLPQYMYENTHLLVVIEEHIRHHCSFIISWSHSRFSRTQQKITILIRVYME